jgi:hypothetical protein
MGASTAVTLYTSSPLKMGQIERSETLVFKLQAPGNYPEESTRYSKHGESLKSRTVNLIRYSNNAHPAHVCTSQSFLNAFINTNTIYEVHARYIVEGRFGVFNPLTPKDV